MAKQESSVENFAGSHSKYPACSHCHFVYGDEKFRQKKVKLIGRHVFNYSRLFQWLIKFLPRIQITLRLVLSVFSFLLLPKFLNFDFIFACSFYSRTQISWRSFVLFTFFLVKVYWFFYYEQEQAFHILCNFFEDNCYNKPLSILISANQMLEFSSCQSLWDKATHKDTSPLALGTLAPTFCRSSAWRRLLPIHPR